MTFLSFFFFLTVWLDFISAKLKKYSRWGEKNDGKKLEEGREPQHKEKQNSDVLLPIGKFRVFKKEMCYSRANRNPRSICGCSRSTSMIWRWQPWNQAVNRARETDDPWVQMCVVQTTSIGSRYPRDTAASRGEKSYKVIRESGFQSSLCSRTLKNDQYHVFVCVWRGDNKRGNLCVCVHVLYNGHPCWSCNLKMGVERKLHDF